MTAHRTPERLAERLEATADKPEDKLPTYQELLDEAVDETFPASDPISPSAAMKPARRVSTGMDDLDWKLESAAAELQQRQHVVAEFNDEQAARQARDEALENELPTAHLELPPVDSDGAGATLTVLACDDEQRELAIDIVRRSGAAHVLLRP